MQGKTRRRRRKYRTKRYCSHLLCRESIKIEAQITVIHKNSSGDEIANVNFFYNIAHVDASAYAH